jgi:Leishmanolysin
LQHYGKDLPKQYQYFAQRDKKDYGGIQPEMDYCSIMHSESRIPGNPMGLCTTPIAWANLPQEDKDRGMIYGPKSICLDNNLAPNDRFDKFAEFQGGCYEWECDPKADTATVTAVVRSLVGTGFTTQSKKCTVPYEALVFDGYEGIVRCPSKLCPDAETGLEGDIKLMNLTAIAEEQRLEAMPTASAPSDIGAGQKTSLLSEGQIVAAALGGVAIVAAVAVAAAFLGMQAVAQRPDPATVSETLEPSISSIGQPIARPIASEASVHCAEMGPTG